MAEPGHKAFEEGWERWVENTPYVGLYWDHTQLRWETYPAEKLVISETSHPAVSVFFAHPLAIWPQLTGA